MQRILIADDDQMIVRLLEHKLKQSGYEVLSVHDGAIALETAITEKPDLIVLDGMMPGLDGMEVLRRLKESEDTKSIPVIMLTARAQETDIVDGLSLGADDYLVKPFIPDELMARIKRYIEK
ncbi:MAG: response regulator [Alphaproteobacteria bacterium]|nr:response regulator [Alphaproteobacteria bacterium]